MYKNKTFNQQGCRQVKIQPDDTLKATSLFYVQDALENEKYEEAANLIESAKSFGASDQEVSQAITQVLVKLNQNSNGGGANDSSFSRF